MLNITSHNGESKIKVEGSITEITYDLTIAVRGLIESLAEQNEMCADMLLDFCKYALPKLADPEVDLNNVDDILDEAVKEHRKAAEEEAKKSLKQIKEMLKGDDELIKTIRELLDDLEDDVK
jgi:hypothetical protein